MEQQTLFEIKDKELMDLKEASIWASQYLGRKVTVSNIAYLLQYGRIKRYKNPDAKVFSYVAIPHNPYEPKPYERWTLKGMLDLNNELKVADEFWDFLGGKGTYVELLDCFERAGIELRPEIDDLFLRFR